MPYNHVKEFGERLIMSYTINTGKFESNFKAYEKELQKGLGNILKSVASEYADKASKYVPPRINGAWKKTIPTKLYKRGVYPLSALIKKDKRNAKEFGEKLKEGFRFLIVGRLHGKPHRWYAKTLRNTAQYRRIYNRGLFKAMFGANLASIGAVMPDVFGKLLSKSPNLLKHTKLNKVSLQTGDTAQVNIGNMAFDNDKFSRQSKYQGEKAGKRILKKEFEQFNKKVYKI